MLLSFRYRLYPLRPQLHQLEDWLHELTFLWNYALAQRRDAWEKQSRSISYLDQQADLTRWRNFDTEGLGQLPCAVAQHQLQRLDLAFKEFFCRVKAGATPGYPKFRRRTRSFSFTPQVDLLRPGPKGSWRLWAPSLGALPLQLHRPPPDGGVPKFVTVRAEAGDWYACIVYAIPDPPTPAPTPPVRPVGIDLGLTKLATLSTGATVDPPRFLRRVERHLADEQRKLARKERGSHRWEKQRRKVERCHVRAARQRRWFAHQISHDWTEEFDLVAMEELNVAGLARGMLAGPVHDAGWSMLRSLVEYKARLRSHRFVAVDPTGTSQTCSVCGGPPIRPLTLSYREFVCSAGHRLDRDHNAALNILQRGVRGIGRKPAEETRGESRPLPSRVGRRAYQRRQVGSMNREKGHPKSTALEAVTRRSGDA